MNDYILVVLTAVASITASSGFWGYMMMRVDRRSNQTRLLLGLAHGRITRLGMEYIDRGWISKDEYDDLVHYLWKPYSQFKGNGLAERVMVDVMKLPIRSKATLKSLYPEPMPVHLKGQRNAEHDN